MFGGVSITWRAAQRLEGRPKVKRCLGAWKASGDSANVERLGHQRALQTVKGISDPGFDWVAQKLERTQKTGGPSSREVLTALFVDRAPPIFRGRLRN